MNIFALLHRKNNTISLNLLYILCTLAVFTALLTPSISHAAPNKKYASLVIDADTGTVLSQENANKSLHPASLTKMMTLLMTFEALDRGDVKLNDSIVISRRAAKAVPSKLGLPVGSRIKIKDAIYILVTKSANDVAIALAEHLGGSESRFAVIMTNRARTIGMNKTRFKNASGLHHPAQITTARDMSKLARYILQRYPHYYKYFATKNYTYRGKTYRNHNRLMETYPGMDGFKTGYINASGFNLVASARRDGRRLIGVVFGGRSGKTRNAHMADILDRGFSKAKRMRFAVAKPPVPSRKPTYQTASTSTATRAPIATPNSYASLTALQNKATQKNMQIVVPPHMPKKKEITASYKVIDTSIQSEQLKKIERQKAALAAKAKRIETARMTAAVHKSKKATAINASHVAPQAGIQKAVRTTTTGLPEKPSRPLNSVGRWSVQIGAFTSRLATDNALRTAMNKLPSNFQHVSPMAVPLRTKDNMVFRARLGGMSRDDAYKACNYISDCMPIAPLSNKTSAKKK